MKNSRKVFVLMEAVLAVMVLLTVIVMMGEKDGKSLGKVSVIIQESDGSQWNALNMGFVWLQKIRKWKCLL